MSDAQFPELFQEHGWYFITWLEDVGGNRWGRMRLDIPKAHYDQLRVWPESALELYVKHEKHKGYRIETDGTVGRSGGGTASKTHSRTQTDAVQRSSRSKTTAGTLAAERATGGVHSRGRVSRNR